MHVEPIELVPGLVGFTRALRTAGLRAGRSTDFIEAVGHLDIGNRDDVYRAGRATLCDDPEDVPTYDRVFDLGFAVERAGGGRVPTTTVEQASAAPLREDESDDGREGGAADRAAALASPREHRPHRADAE